VSVSLAEAGAQSTGGSGTDVVSGFENLIGSKFADSLTGDSIANVLKAGEGNDVLNGDAGADAMEGGVGNDEWQPEWQASYEESTRDRTSPSRGV
jgi:Ca2+-binding RTX toxin-like protein